MSEVEAANIDDEDRRNLIRAMGARRAKEYAEGLGALAGIPEEVEAELRWQLAGEMLEGLGRYDEAFAAFAAMNRAHTFDPSDPLSRAAQHRQMLRDQLERTTADWRQSWKAPAIASSRPAPVFLVGFPRSGTTLLDTILMGHPGIAVLEEQSLLKAIGLGFDGFERVADIAEEELRALQDRYFALAAEKVKLTDNTLLIDKSPLNLQLVPQIMRLFPDARFILAMRHPADVVFGCFKANFRLNNAMSSFLALDTAAEFYDLTFRTWENSLKLFSPEVHTVRYAIPDRGSRGGTSARHRRSRPGVERSDPRSSEDRARSRFGCDRQLCASDRADLSARRGPLAALSAPPRADPVRSSRHGLEQFGYAG